MKRVTARIKTLVMLANAMDANVSVLITPRTTLAPLDERDPALDAIRHAVTYGGVPGLDGPDEPPVDKAATLGAGAATAWRVWQSGDYSTVAALLLIPRLDGGPDSPTAVLGQTSRQKALAEAPPLSSSSLSPTSPPPIRTTTWPKPATSSACACRPRRC